MATINPFPPLQEDWVEVLNLKRSQGRRMQPDGPPPYMTVDGPILVDRRSHQDRRKALCAVFPGDTRCSDDKVPQT